MILSLKLENWKSHSSSSFRFGKGTNIILGRMGSGKSSVLDALCFALYGTFPKMQRKDQTVEHLVSSGSGAEFAEIALEFEKGGETYCIMRRIGKKLSEAEIRKGDRLLTKGPKPVTELATSTLGVDYDLFTRAIYSEQNKIDYLLTLNPRQRKTEIDWLLGLGRFDDAREAAQAAAGKLSEQAEIFLADASEQRITEAASKAADASEQKAVKEKLSAALRENATAMESKVKEKSSSLAILEKKKAAWKESSNSVERNKALAERLSKETEGKEKPQELEAKRISRQETEEKIKQQKEKLKQANLSLASSKSALAVAESSLKAASESEKRKSELSGKIALLSGGKMQETLEKELVEEKEELQLMVELHASLHAQSQELEKAIEALSNASARCPVCDSDLSGGKASEMAGKKKAQIAEGLELSKKHLAEMMEKKNRVSGLEKNLVEIKSAQSELLRISTQAKPLQLLEAEIAKLKEQKSSIEKELEALDSALPKLEAALEKARSDLEGAERLHKLFAELDSAKSRLAEAEAHLAELKFSEQAYEQARTECEAARVGLASCQAELAGEEKQLALLSQMDAELRSELSRLQEKHGIGKQYALASESMAIYKNSLIAAQSEMRCTLVEEINQALAEVWPAVYPYSDYSGVKIEADEKDYRLLMQKSEWLEVDAIASGGERACLCLALRIAFATVLTPDLSWLILDEPTHNLDSDAVQMLSEAIARKIPTIVEQTFVITHDPILGETGEGAVFRLERDKSKNEHTKISQD